MSYDVSFSIKDGAVDPACATSCDWKVEAYYDDGTTEKLQRVLGSGNLVGPVLVYGTRFTGTNLHPGEITELRASVTPVGATEPQYTDVVQVSDPYPDGDVDLQIDRWEVDGSSGDATYEMNVAVSGAGQVNGPCDGVCYLYVEAIHRDGSVDTVVHSFIGGLVLSPSWAYSQAMSGTVSSTGVTHLRARVEPSGGSRERHEDVSPVSDYIYKGHDINASAASVAPVFTRNPTLFCTTFLLRAGTHYLRSTLTDQFLACEAAVLAGEIVVSKILERIVDAGGGPSIDVWVDDRRTPFPQPDSSMPEIPEDWDDETGCKQEIPEWSVDAIAWHIEEEHGYTDAPSEEGVLSYWGEDVPWRDLVYPYAMRYKARPSVNYADSCVREINFEAAPVGYEPDFDAPSGQPGWKLTNWYTVVTDKDTGILRTAYPGHEGN